MRDIRRKQGERSHIKLSRGADGRLRASTVSSDIGDIWAEQKRIRLAEAIQEDQKKAEKAKRRAEPKEVVVKIGLPKVRLPRVPKVILKWPKVSKRAVLAGGVLVLVVAMGFAGFTLFGGKEKAQKTSTGILDAKDQRPGFDTVLPAGKSIQELGGWARVSPPDKDPVFAYIDTVDGVQVNVSQQPLPDNLKKDLSGELAKLAEQFNAKEMVAVGNMTAYIGTSIKGPQSVVFATEQLLVLIKSYDKLSNERWATYLSSLE